MKNNKKISLKEIAELSGVSIATVSRVLNNNGRFSEETGKRVMDIIKEHDYTVNMAAKSLRVSKSKTIGVIVPDINNEFFSNVVLEIEKFFFDKGYSVFICNTNQDELKEEAYFRSLDSKLVDGIICISGRENIPLDVIKRNIPIVCIDRKPKSDTNAIYVESDHYLGGFMATEELIKKGCKRILTVTKGKSLSVNNQRLQGYKDALIKYGFSVDDNLIVKLSDTRSNFEEARDMVTYLIKKGLEFDGIFATNDWRAHGALVALQQNNISVPHKVKIVGFDGISISKFCYPPITTIYQDKKKIALEASELLYKLINGEEIIDAKHVVIPVSLVVRGTT
ncbi:LacI family DNA-binding transcriptional regulator [Clostridium sp. Marseille-Q2269]|uniref:LacI family DNA-binding transcriptional regulator n=1 Tax=Clostridium sp. Marseille-Q2269 TaxID=2942205 RepID=UPI002074310C|nr:LacI family DNA-binding transcriptional regulator [Clostridium sp. Marseille-Q2269]